MGFTKTVAVPEGDRLGFVILVREGVELMLQTAESVRKDAPSLAPKSETSPAYLFIEVDDFSEVLSRLQGYPIAMPERTTFYGMREIGTFAPGGHVVIFAARVAE